MLIVGFHFAFWSTICEKLKSRPEWWHLRETVLWWGQLYRYSQVRQRLRSSFLKHLYDATFSNIVYSKKRLVERNLGANIYNIYIGSNLRLYVSFVLQISWKPTTRSCEDLFLQYKILALINWQYNINRNFSWRLRFTGLNTLNLWTQ